MESDCAISSNAIRSHVQSSIFSLKAKIPILGVPVSIEKVLMYTLNRC